jgi:glycosyltransferase involved in cell wall biosynthesis
MIRILLVTQSKHNGLTYHRQLIPHTNLERNYLGEYEVIPCHDIDLITDNELQTFNIVSFLRLINEKNRSKEIIDRCKKAGCKVVIDIDDYWHLHRTHGLHETYEKYKIAQQTVDGLINADYVTTTTEHFSDKIKEFNKNVLVLSNSIDTTVEQFQEKSYYSDRLRFGWVGGIYHAQDVRLMYEGFKDVFKNANSNKFQLCLGGFGLYDEYKFLEMVYTDEYKNIKNLEYKKYLLEYKQQNNHLAECEPYKRLWGKSVWDYGTLYNEIDVALVPLVETSFNSFKSQIKIIEAGFFKKAVIVSNVMPYTIDCKKHNSILISPSKRNEGWGVAIKSLIHNPERAKELGEKMYETVKDKYNMDNVNISRNQLYKLLCE